jgi:acetylornithine deacetylase
MPTIRTLPPLLDLIRDLIALPSISCTSPDFDQSNLSVIECLAEWCELAGFATEIMVIPGHPGKANLIATLGRGEGGLVLAGHTDTVPYDSAHWHYDPFRLTEAQGRLYGLGTSDMKAFFALVLETVRTLKSSQFKRPLILLATADEESSMCGAQALVDAQRRLGRYALIGEPSGMRPARLHKGILMEAIRVRGQAGHSSDPALGNSALEGMHQVMSALLKWRRELQARYHNAAFSVPVPTLNLGHIHGGDNPNRICGECELHIDLRPLPGMGVSELRAALRHCVEDALRDSGLHVETFPLFSGIAAMETPASAAIVKSAEILSGFSANALGFGTEAPYLQQLGMDTVILGPGDIEQAHQPDEFIRLDRLVPMRDLLLGLIGQYCLQPSA